MSQHPRETQQLFGHDEALGQIKSAFHAGKMHHAWIIAGDEGIGKATFAYHVARFILAQTSSPERVNALITAQAHPNLLTLEAPLEKTATGLSRDIPIDNVRKIHPFFGATAMDEGYRLCIVDACEDLNRNGANALLKMVEEPPEKAMFLLISHAPYRLLPTIRSRARLLKLNALSNENLTRALFAQGQNDAAHVLENANGSVSRANMLLNPQTLKLIQTFEKATQHKNNMQDILTLAELVAGKEYFLFEEFLSLYRNHLLECAKSAPPLNVNTFTSLYTRFNEEASKVIGLNLERKSFAIAALTWLNQR
jgi:DNA polymerase III subunit delta'